MDNRFKLDAMALTRARILDMNPGKDRESREQVPSVVFNDHTNILDRIYLVRCNLFHGQKSITDRNDSILVELAYRILSAWFEPIVESL